MKVLSIEQMSRLKELCVDVKPKGFGMIYQFDGGNSYRLIYGESTCEDDMAAFDLQDIIELLPAEIETSEHCYSLTFSKTVFSDICFNCYYFTETQDDSFSLINFYDGEILDAAYLMLIWVIENGHLSTKTI